MIRPFRGVLAAFRGLRVVELRISLTGLLVAALLDFVPCAPGKQEA